MVLSENLRRQLPPHIVAALTGAAIPSVDEEIQQRLNDEEIRKAIAENFGEMREEKPVDNSIGKGTDVVLEHFPLARNRLGIPMGREI